jgi:hypothetical protein
LVVVDVVGHTRVVVVVLEDLYQEVDLQYPQV